MENWQSEFLQLMWQVGGLSFLPYVGSPQSKESSDRLEAKIDLLINNLKTLAENPENARALVNELDDKYYKKIIDVHEHAISPSFSWRRDLHG